MAPVMRPATDDLGSRLGPTARYCIDGRVGRFGTGLVEAG
jgi:hypothetical protein